MDLEEILENFGGIISLFLSMNYVMVFGLEELEMCRGP